MHPQKGARNATKQTRHHPCPLAPAEAHQRAARPAQYHQRCAREGARRQPRAGADAEEAPQGTQGPLRRARAGDHHPPPARRRRGSRARIQLYHDHRKHPDDNGRAQARRQHRRRKHRSHPLGARRILRRAAAGNGKKNEFFDGRCTSNPLNLQKRPRLFFEPGAFLCVCDKRKRHRFLGDDGGTPASRGTPVSGGAFLTSRRYAAGSI